MKKFLSILLALAVGFTFTFGSAMSAFAAMTPDEVTNVKTALMSKSSELQSALKDAGDNYLKKCDFNEDEILLSADDPITGDAADIVTKKAVEKRIADVVEEGQRLIDTKAKELQDAVTASSTTDVTTEVTKLVNYYKSDVLTTIADTTVLGTGNIDVLKEQYSLSLKAANDAVAKYTADIDKYSDNILEKTYKTTDQLNESYGTVLSHTGPDYTVSTVTNLSANASTKGFVKSLLEKQALNINNAKITLALAITSNIKDAINAFNDAATTLKDIMEGHLIGKGDDAYYVAKVPTIEDLAGDKTLDSAKSAAIREIKADLSAAAVKIENTLTAELAALKKNAKPDTKAIKELEDAIADLSDQFAAAEEVYTAVINYCTTTGAVATEKANIKSEISNKLNNVSSFAGFKVANGAKALLEGKVTISENVAALKAEAALLKAQKDVNGQPLYEEGALKDALDEQIEKAYTQGTSYSLATGKNALAAGSEAGLVLAKRNHINYINGIATPGFEPLNKYGLTITATNAKGEKAWNKASATRTGSAVTVMDGYVAEEAGKIVAVYDDAQAKELKALVAETEKAISEAKTTAEVREIFAAAQVKYEEIKKTSDHNADWADSGKLGKAYIDGKYGNQLTKYVDYIASKVNLSKNYYATNAQLIAAAKAIMFEAYTKEELPAKFEAAKTMLDSIKTKDEVKVEKAKVEELIAALPTAPAVTDKDAVVAAADAYVAYNEIPGNNPTISNAAKLVAAAAAFEKADAEAVDAAYKALPAAKNVTTANAAAIESLRTAFDAHKKLCAKYGWTNTVSVTNENVTELENALSAAKVTEVRTLLIALPANPTAENKAQVEAARAAYEALSYGEKAQIVGTIAYKNLIDAEEALDIKLGFDESKAKAYVQDLAIAVRTAKVGKKVKVTVKADVQTLIDNGYTVEYKFYKSTKKGSGYKNTVNKTANTYTNTNPVKGKNYYKVKLVVKNADGTVVATTPLTQCKYGVRTIK